MASEDALCLENIDEFVNDENKIVTCKWLSLTLKIHINQAKRLLYTFLQQQRKKKRDVNATYFVAGLAQRDNGHMEHHCLVVSEADLDATRSRLATVTSCHIYSIQRSNLKDSNSLYITDYEGVQENLTDCNKYSSIHYEKAAKLHSKPSRKALSPDRTLASVGMGDGQVQKPISGSGADKPVSGEPQGGKGRKAEPKGSIATMFAQAVKSKETTAAIKKTEASAKDKEEAKENKPGTKKGSVMDLFANTKQAAKPRAAAVVEKKTAVSKESEPGEQKSKAVSEASRSKKSRPKDDSDLDEQPDKKRRRRIKNDLFDSSSEEEMEIEAESPEPSPVRVLTPEPDSPTSVAQKTPEKCQKDPSPSIENNSATNGNKQRRRQRKLVPKTYLDEEGFMVTEKVWESESTDASEVEEDKGKKSAVAAPPKKSEPVPAKKASPQKKASPVKGKQTSLMSFFKKK